jgi:hypothetical protein
MRSRPETLRRARAREGLETLPGFPSKSTGWTEDARAESTGGDRHARMNA